MRCVLLLMCMLAVLALAQAWNCDEKVDHDGDHDSSSKDHKHGSSDGSNSGRTSKSSKGSHKSSKDSKHSKDTSHSKTSHGSKSGRSRSHSGSGSGGGKFHHKPNSGSSSGGDKFHHKPNPGSSSGGDKFHHKPNSGSNSGGDKFHHKPHSGSNSRSSSRGSKFHPSKSSSSDSSHSFDDDHIPHYPKSCNPCDVIDFRKLDQDNQYYRECGQYLYNNIIQPGQVGIVTWWKRCESAGCYADKLKILEKVRLACFVDFWVVIYFQCPVVDICEGIEGCSLDNIIVKNPTDLIDACYEKKYKYHPAEECDVCYKLTQQGNAFYKWCGSKIDDMTVQTWAAMCEDAETMSDRQAILDMVYAHCYCVQDGTYYVPDPCVCTDHH